MFDAAAIPPSLPPSLLSSQDDPRVTQPLMYSLIHAHPPCLGLYSQRLMEEGVTTQQVRVEEGVTTQQVRVSAGKEVS